MPMKFIISETDEILVSHSGMALAGSLLRGTAIQKRINRIRLGDRKRPEVPHGDVATAMIGLLCLGKPDFEAIEAFREDEFFRQALGLAKADPFAHLPDISRHIVTTVGTQTLVEPGHIRHPIDP